MPPVKLSIISVSNKSATLCLSELNSKLSHLCNQFICHNKYMYPIYNRNMTCIKVTTQKVFYMSICCGFFLEYQRSFYEKPQHAILDKMIINSHCSTFYLKLCNVAVLRECYRNNKSQL